MNKNQSVTLPTNPFILQPIHKLSVALILLIICALFSLAIGHEYIRLNVVLQAMLQYDPLNIEHVLVQTTRLSRTIIAMVVGACLAVAGTLMQALTRNPLASPGIFGINAGAMFSVVLFSGLFALDSLGHSLWLAFFGAAIAGILVYFLGMVGQRQLNTLRIVLAGAAVTALFSSFTQAMLVIDQEGLDSILFWLAGSVANRQLNFVWPVLPYMMSCLFLIYLLAKPINILMAGEEIAKGLGQRTILIQVMMGIAIIILAGGAVAIAGNIAFIGLIVPHIVRRLISSDHQWLIPGCAILGALLLLLADILARLVIFPQEIPIGVMTALLGAPFFIYLVRKGMRHG
ncbi:FecCD family ABC transporter permease [Acinetobacter courvalinii]|uniref:Siderophore ABC transporter permease n=1 Tax=Acinetobacter courvalinii TaxID=280147 RepID=N9RFS0_9GAMM|nr:iron ABC transporter permease [Acinetobacter courvalinii]ENX37465.1 hypothetical protein F888_02802 [Acinetobacter courvalinii]KAB0658817.1 iron ABC transporter permease [Acinetobacter courvalinii]RSN84739.1 iron ABC transporter permease [Acinetobacter baumannii]GGH27167.1 siderophore ABC transporter permease [Acinetobacter courvalinii]